MQVHLCSIIPYLVNTILPCPCLHNTSGCTEERKGLGPGNFERFHKRGDCSVMVVLQYCCEQLRRVACGGCMHGEVPWHCLQACGEQ